MLALMLVTVVALNVWADFIDRRSTTASDINALALWTTIIQFALVVPLIGLVRPAPLELLIPCAAVAAFSVWARHAWFTALSSRTERLSRLAPISRLSSVVTLALAFAVLREQVSTEAVIGATTMVVGGLLISFRRETPDLRAYARENKALVLVALFAASSATITILYKHSLNVGIGIISAYFYLKAFQFAFAMAFAAFKGQIARSYSAIDDLPLFIRARVIQTAAALAYLFVLSKVPLAFAVPITAVAGPLLYLLIERLAGKYEKAGVNTGRVNRIVEGLGLLAVLVGGYILAGGQ
jgi:uncharacterized membrane protein